MKIITTILLLLATGLSPLAQNKGRSTSSISGRVTDAQTREGIESVMVVDTSSKPARVTYTDAQGKYSLDSLPSGRKGLIFSIVGYKIFKLDTVTLVSGQKRVIDVKLTPNVANNAEVTVVGQARRVENPFASVYKLDVREIDRAPGGNRDISKVVQNLPGVASTPSYRNDLIVRGGGPNENKYYLDKIEIPVLNHFQTQGSGGGNASIVNSDFLRSATLFTSAFPVAMPGALSSVLDLRMTEGNSERFKAKFAVGASDISATIDTPLGDKGGLIASYRTSYLQFLFAMLKLPFLPTYNDAQFKFTYHFDDRNHLTILGLGALDNNKLNTNLTDLSPSRQQILNYLPENDQWSYVVGAVYRHDFDGSHLNVIASTNRLNNQLDKWTNNDKSLPKTLDYTSNEIEGKARVEFDAELGRGWVISTGANVDRVFYDNHSYRLIFVGGRPVDDIYNSELYLTRYGAFFGADKLFSDGKLRLNMSIRVDGNNYSSYMNNPLQQLSPRLAMNYKFAPRWSLNASLGRYYQEPSYTTLGFRNPAGDLVNKNRLRYINSDQATVGFSWTPTKDSKLSLDGFYKLYGDYPMSLIDSTAIGSNSLSIFAVGAEPVSSVGKSRAYGLEFQYRNDNLWGFRFYFAYTYYYSQYRKLDNNFEPTGRYVATNWDNRHLINVMLSRDLGRGWEVGTRWRFSGGSPTTPYDLNLSSNIDIWNSTGRAVLDYSLYNTMRMPVFHQLDVRVDKQWDFKKWSIGIYLDIQNLYNYKSVGKDILMPAVDGTGNYIIDPNNPGHYVMQTLPNDAGGTIVPTFGLIVEF